MAALLALLGKAARLTPRDWWRLLLGQVALLRARRDVRTRPQGELVTTGPADARSGSAADPQRIDEVRRVVLGVSRASVYGVFHPTCLVRSLAICRRLDAEGLPGSAVRVGVARRQGKFMAHAWVEYAGEVVGDDEGTVDRYASFDDLQVSTRP
ncbi:MAG: lasso peptide biosynthesis B2 protein [Gemmatimonadaceae bacterium]|nr:lasso peptide biosynthesis B2 protein [Gemmatimonadaceae bacterium]